MPVEESPLIWFTFFNVIIPKLIVGTSLFLINSCILCKSSCFSFLRSKVAFVFHLAGNVYVIQADFWRSWNCLDFFQWWPFFDMLTFRSYCYFYLNLLNFPQIETMATIVQILYESNPCPPHCRHNLLSICYKIDTFSTNTTNSMQCILGPFKGIQCLRHWLKMTKKYWQLHYDLHRFDQLAVCTLHLFPKSLMRPSF